MSNVGRVLGVALGLLCCCAWAGEVSPPSAAEVSRAIDRGLAFIRKQQQAEGSIAAKDDAVNAVTALSVLAHLAAGITPDLPEKGPAVRRMLVYLLAHQDEQGFFGADGGRMYAHGMVCMALADALGTTRDDDLDERMRTSLVRGLTVTVAAARVVKGPPYAGGWRYMPYDNSSDLSLTGWQMMSLHAARRIGLAVPDEVAEAAINYVRGMVDDQGHVGYALRGEDHIVLRGLALLALSLRAGERPPEVERILVRVREDGPAWQGPWFFYRSYYDAAGIPRADPKLWAQSYRAALFRILVDHQAEDGSWQVPPGGEGEQGVGPAYAAAMAVLALAMERRLLPAQQP